MHAYGRIEFFNDADRLLYIVSRLTDLHEGLRTAPWAVMIRLKPSRAPSDRLKGIFGLRLPITRLDGKREMSQDRTVGDKAGVVAGLASNSRQSDRAIAVLIPG